MKIGSEVIDIMLQFLQIFATFFIAFVGWRITINYNKIQLNEMEQKYKPYLIITKLVNNSKQNNNEEFFKGSKVPTMPYRKIKDINELKDSGLYEINLKKRGKGENGTVYHMMYNNERHLIFNFLDNEKDIIFDCAPTIIVIKNVGYDLCSYCIDT